MSENLRSVFLCIKHFWALVLGQGAGQIISIAWVRSFDGGAKAAAYAPSQATVAQLARCMSIEWGPRVQQCLLNCSRLHSDLDFGGVHSGPGHQRFRPVTNPDEAAGLCHRRHGAGLVSSIPVDGGWLSA